MTLNHGDLGALFMVVADCPALESLRVVCRGQRVHRGTFALCEPLRNPVLRSVDLDVSGACLDGDAVGALVDLLGRGSLPALTEVHLDLRHNHFFKASDMGHLAPLLDPGSRLRVLDIAVTGNTWNGDHAVACLAADCGDTADRPTTTTLHTLRLMLSDTGLSGWGVQYGIGRILAAHRGSLRAFTFHAANCDLSTGNGVRVLMAALVTLPALARLELVLACNGLRDSGAFACLARLTNCRHLHLDLSGNLRMGERTAHALGHALRHGFVHHLQLHLRQTAMREGVHLPIGTLLALHTLVYTGPGAGAPGLLRHCDPHALRHLRLLLAGDTGVGDAGCHELAEALRPAAATLEHLVLHMAGNGIGDDGLAAVLDAVGWLRSLFLRCEANELTVRSLPAVRALLARSTRAAYVHLDLSNNRDLLPAGGGVAAILAVLCAKPPGVHLHWALRGVLESAEERHAVRACSPDPRVLLLL
jgi:hypothetical protein